ncbi:response regulator receiver domain-containing protein [Dyadobacter jejuensis]|uniref:Response regulator receiver domain-containing protein n=1 Tax=Dyadobacter jejuensis TaxID=1082580 RepID=A0A316ANG9_9BACT|nr:response regulator [Dyadobacter jejuensis]PWJ59273.1 response regulator receiver domain-containing protein [Dyadobacter jejuensis]
MKIVIIEDEKDLSTLMRNFLIKQFQTDSSAAVIKIAHTLSEGKHIVSNLKPDWIFLDNNLPDGKGINEIVHLKSTPSPDPVKVVMMSAMTNLRDEALHLGADFFLDKPISFNAVIKIIASNS